MNIENCLSIVQHGLCKMSEEEYRWLHKLVSENCHTSDLVVELGCFAGSGSVVLSGACQEVGAMSIHIDLWEGDWGEITLNLWQNQMRRAGQFHRSILHRETTGSAHNSLKLSWDSAPDGKPRGRIALLVIDANHEYPWPKDDLTRFAPHIRPGGVVVWHDCVDPQVLRSINEHLGEGGEMQGWQELQTPKAPGEKVTRDPRYHIPIPDNWMSRGFKKPS